MIAAWLACVDPVPSSPRGQATYADQVVVRVLVREPADLERLAALGADPWSEHVDDEVLARIPRAALPALPGAVVVIDDLPAAIAAAAPRGLVDAEFSADWRPWSEIDAHLDELASRLPGARVEDVGTSVEGRGLRALVLDVGHPAPDDRLGILVTGAQHAREWVAASSAMYVAERLVDGYGVDPELTALLDAYKVFVIPVANPDGYEFTWTTDRMWRKNRTDNGDGSFGIDLNRNWDAAWGGAGSATLPASDNYRGAAAFSEPETAAIADWLDGHPRVGLYLDLHCTGQLALRPWGWTPLAPPDEAVLASGSEAAALALSAPYGTPYDEGPFNTRLYPASGVAVDWAYGVRGMWAWLFELRDKGQYGFLLPADQIAPTGEEVLGGLLALAAVPERPRIWLRAPLPFVAGERRALIGARAPHDAVVELYRSDRGLGVTALPDGATLELADAALVATRTADEHGRVEFVLHVPEDWAGDTVWYEARSGDQRSTIVSREVLP